MITITEKDFSDNQKTFINNLVSFRYPNIQAATKEQALKWLYEQVPYDGEARCDNYLIRLGDLNLKTYVLLLLNFITISNNRHL